MAVRLKNITIVHLYILLLVGLLGACSTDFEVNAPYVKLPVVYAFLDPSEGVQYARVQRTFQNRTGDARTIAENNRDSSEFRPGEIEVSLWQAGNPDRLIGKYQPFESSDKDTNGSFYAPNQTLYKLPLPLGTISEAVIYRIKIKNRFTNDSSVQAVTRIVGPFNIEQPTNELTRPIDSLAKKTFYIDPREKSKFEIKYYPNCNARLTNMNMRIIYREYSTGGTFQDYDIWYKQALNLIESSVSTECGRAGRSDAKVISITSSPIFQAMVDSIPPADNTVAYRNWMKVECYFYAASQQLADFQNTNLQFIPISQSVPTYSNISGGIGLFASVRSEKVSAYFQPGLANLMNQPDLTGSASYPKLAALKFRTR